MSRKIVIAGLIAALGLAGASCSSGPTDATPAPSTTAATTTATTAATSTSTTPAPAEAHSLTFIAMGEDGAPGPLGCGDTAVAVPVDAADLPGLMRAQLSAPEQTWVEAGLYNALAYSELEVESAEVRDGTARITLSGELMLAGECDIPRVREQLTAPARQFEGVREVEVFINGEPLEGLLDLRG